MGTKRKITDIYPPKSFPPSFRGQKRPLMRQAREERLPSHRSFPWIFFGMGALGVLFGAAGIINFFFAKATITIVPETRIVEAREVLTASVGKEDGDFERKVIPGALHEKEKEGTRVFSSSGKKLKEAKAEGVIQVINTYSSAAQVLVANTRFISEEGKLFYTKERVSVPGKRKEGGKVIPGTQDVPVIAAEAGEEYNIKPSNFSIPAFAGSPRYTSIYGKSYQPMRGGARTEVAVVTESDITAAHDQIIQDLTKQAKEAIILELSPDRILLPQSFQAEELEALSLVKAGAELAQFNYRAKVKVVALSFSSQDIKRFGEALLNAKVQTSEKIHLPSLQFTYEHDTFDGENKMLVFDLNVSAKAYKELNVEEIKGTLRGLSLSQARETLSAYPHIANAEIKSWPFWTTRIPRDPKRITIHTSLD